MNDWIFNVTFNALVHGSLVFAVAVAADRFVLRRRVSAQGRYLVFLGVLALFLMPGFWNLQIPESEAAVRATVAGEVSFGELLDEGIAPVIGAQHALVASKANRGEGAMFGALGWSLVWGIGFLGMLWRLREGRRRMRRVVGESRGGGLDAGVVWTDSVGPCVTGYRRPVVLVPEHCRSFSEKEMRWILAHERLHIERGDLWAQAAQQVVLAVLWFHPLVWWTHRRINRLREFAVDAAVTRGREDRSAYCEVLVRVASMEHRKPFWGAGLAMASATGSSKQRLEERIHNCLSPSEEREGRRAWHWLALVLPVLLLGIPGGCQTGVVGESFVDPGNSEALPALVSVPKAEAEASVEVPDEVNENVSQIKMAVRLVQVLKADVPADMDDGKVVDVATLNALEAVRGRDVLIAPTVYSLENEAATIEIGRQVMVPGEGTNDFQAVDVGVFVEVVSRLAVAQPDSGPATIELQIKVRKSDLLDERQVRSQQVETALVAASGTTMLVGRMEQTNVVTIEDASWFGLVRSKSVEETERTTLVFVTPTLAHKSGSSKE